MNMLIVGYSNEIIAQLKKTFNVQFVISNSQNSNIKWDEFHNLSPDVMSKELDCLSSEIKELIKNFEKFSDMSTRRYAVLNGHHGETRNILMLYMYNIVHILRKHQISVVLFSNMPHEGFDFVLYQIAKLRKIRTIITSQTQFDNRFWLLNSMDEFGKIQKQPKLNTNDLDLSLPSTWHYMRDKSKFTQRYHILGLLRDILKKPLKLPVYIIKYYYSKRYFQSWLSCKTISGVPDLNCKYIYYPLHLQPEMTVSALDDENGIYSDQMLIIETLSKKVPKNTKIIIKENPKQDFRYRDPFFFKRLSRLTNVIIAHPDTNSRELIRHSEGVATLSGTAGWEALNLGKPCLTFGKAWYNALPGVSLYRDSFNFETWQNTPVPGIEMLHTSARELLCQTGLGVVDLHYAKLVEQFDPIQNAVTVSDSIKKFLAYEST